MWILANDYTNIIHKNKNVYVFDYVWFLKIYFKHDFKEFIEISIGGLIGEIIDAVILWNSNDLKCVVIRIFL